MSEPRSERTVDVASAADPVAAVLAAHADGDLISLRTSGTTSRPRSVVRTAASWVDSFPDVSRLTGITDASRVWVPGPLSATMNLFAAVHARWAGAAVVADARAATHAQLAPTALARWLDEGGDPGGLHVVVAGDRLSPALARRVGSAGGSVSHYYGAAELSFVAWGTSASDLRAFPGVAVEVRDGRIWVRSPYVARGYDGGDGPLTTRRDGFASVGDRGRLSDGVLTVLGRGGAAVQTGGATVVVDDVEDCLRSAVRSDVLVLGLRHGRLGSVVAAVLTDGSVVGRLRKVARRELSAAQRPRLWFSIDRLPVTREGKVDRRALRGLVEAGAPGVRRLSVTGTRTAAR